MNKLFAVLLLAALAAGVFAQEFKISGEVKTGLIQTTTDDQISPDGDKRTKKGTYTAPGSKDDAGTGSGRFRINAEYSNGNVGIKFRMQMENWGSSGGDNSPAWPYAFGYSNFLEDQLTVSLGKLGDSPWGTGGPELWQELESIASLGGMRFEIKPNFAPGLNVGFVINDFDGSSKIWTDDEKKPVSFLDVLQESVVGISYTHDLFMIRTAYRFDSEVDRVDEDDPGNGREGGKIAYRIEEHIIEQYLPGFSIWALGYWYGLGKSGEYKYRYAEVNADIVDARNWVYDAQNWLFIQYAPDFLTAQLRVGYDVIADRQFVHVKPGVYAHLFNRLLTVGGFFWYGQDFGNDKISSGSPYAFIEYEPLLQLNMSENSYVAAAYNWRKEYVADDRGVYKERDLEPTKTTQWINVRVGMTF